MTQPDESNGMRVNVRNPRAQDLLPATSLRVNAGLMNADPHGGLPMWASASFDSFATGTAYGRTFCEALRNLADVLESNNGVTVRGYHPVRAQLHEELDKWLDGELEVADAVVISQFRTRLANRGE